MPAYSVPDSGSAKFCTPKKGPKSAENRPKTALSAGKPNLCQEHPNFIVHSKVLGVRAHLFHTGFRFCNTMDP
jgi:hypothetical protein